MRNTLDHMFRFNFQRTHIEVVEKCKSRADAIRAKVSERQQRVVDLRREHDISDAALIQLLTEARKTQNEQSAKMSYTYGSNAFPDPSPDKPEVQERTIGAGIVNFLMTESDLIEAEKDQVRRLDLIARNLKPVKTYATGNGAEIPAPDVSLTYEELEFLGF